MWRFISGLSILFPWSVCLTLRSSSSWSCGLQMSSPASKIRAFQDEVRIRWGEVALLPQYLSGAVYGQITCLPLLLLFPSGQREEVVRMDKNQHPIISSEFHRYNKNLLLKSWQQMESEKKQKKRILNKINSWIFHIEL